DLYLKIDVLLLANVFENFRDTCIESYELDPAYYYTLPGYTWNAMLKYTGIRFELLTDIDMVMFVERGIRGGLSQCSHRYAQANNKYNASSYDPSEPSTYLMYFDVNNLYGWAMSESLPYGEFQWVDDIERFDVMSVSSDSVIGYILEVDLYTDTDSLIYLLECENVYEDIKRDIARFETIQSRRQSCIRSTLHEVYTVSELKLALSPYDDKRLREKPFKKPSK
ncbi:hypothetical protein ALC57_03972, partial [Trachymyrmex cornetzi]